MCPITGRGIVSHWVLEDQSMHASQYRDEFFKRFVKISYEIVMSVTSIGRQFRIAGAEFVKPRHG